VYLPFHITCDKMMRHGGAGDLSLRIPGILKDTSKNAHRRWAARLFF
jgi:hypothetical protein